MIINIQAFNATRQGQPAHLRRARRLPVPQPDRRDQRATGRSSSSTSRRRSEAPRPLGGAGASSTPLMMLRYSATHKVEHNKVHRLDALDAYNQKLVKKIAVRGITVQGPRRHHRLPLPRRASRSPRRPARRRGSRSRCRPSGGDQAPAASVCESATNLHDLVRRASRQYKRLRRHRHRRQPTTSIELQQRRRRRGRARPPAT